MIAEAACCFTNSIVRRAMDPTLMVALNVEVNKKVLLGLIALFKIRIEETLPVVTHPKRYNRGLKRLRKNRKKNAAHGCGHF